MTWFATRSLAKSFGGLAAVADVSLEVPRGEVRAIIGPNGAGKSTLAGLVSGRIHPSSGKVLLEGRDITSLPAWRRARLGIVYTFQITSVFAEFSARENVALAAQRAGMSGLSGLLVGDEGGARARVDEALAAVGLGADLDRPAATLAYGHRRLLEIAMGLALRPKLLIMDEPTQGLSDAEIEGVCRLVRAIAAEATVLLIEHNMAVVMALADTITVLDRGRILAEGSPEAIRADAAVRAAYLGA